MTTQVRNSELSGLIEGDFTKRNGPANFSSIRINSIGIPIEPGWILSNMFGMTAGFSGTSIDPGTGNLVGLKGDIVLSNAGTPQVTISGDIAAMSFNGSNQYFYAVNSWWNNIDHENPGIINAYDGILLGCWFYPSSASPASYWHLHGKFPVTTADRSYRLAMNTSGNVVFEWYDIGRNFYSLASSNTVTANQWNFVCGGIRYGINSSIFLNGTWTTGSYLTIGTTSQNYSIGARYDSSSPDQFFAGMMRMIWIAAGFGTTDHIEQYYEMSRSIYT